MSAPLEGVLSKTMLDVTTLLLTFDLLQPTTILPDLIDSLTKLYLGIQRELMRDDTNGGRFK
jgi:hypothetical protein